MVRRRHRFDPSIVREDGLHGIFGKTLSLADAEVLGRAVGTLIRKAGGSRIALAFDGRMSSPDLAAAVTAGAMATGVDVLRVGRGPTPMLYFAVQHLQADGGIMVTGSHTPAAYNGFKLVIGKYPCREPDIKRVIEIAATGEFVHGEGARIERPVFEEYLDHLLSDWAGAVPLKVAWDLGNGVAGETIAALTRHLPGTHLLVNEVVDGSFPCHLPDPANPKTHAQLRRLVASDACDLGIALDGDGDQLAVFDEKGKHLRTDLLMILLSRDILEDHPGATIVVDITASRILLDEIVRCGGVPVLWKSSSLAIKNKMIEIGASLAGHMDGSILLASRRYIYDDAVFAALRILEVTGSLKHGLSEFRKSLPPVAYNPVVRIRCRAHQHAWLIDKIGWDIAERGGEVVVADGIRVTTGDGWWALRPWTNSTDLIATLEAWDEWHLARLKQSLAQELARNGVAVPTSLTQAAA